MTNRATLIKHKTRITGLLSEKIDDISDTLTQFPATDPYVKLKYEEKNALRYALKLIEKELEETKTSKTKEKQKEKH